VLKAQLHLGEIVGAAIGEESWLMKDMTLHAQHMKWNAHSLTLVPHHMIRLGMQSERD